MKKLKILKEIINALIKYIDDISPIMAIPIILMIVVLGIVLFIFGRDNSNSTNENEQKDVNEAESDSLADIKNLSDSEIGIIEKKCNELRKIVQFNLRNAIDEGRSINKLSESTANTLDNLKAQFSSVEKKIRNGVIDDKSSTEEINKIRLNLIEIVSDIQRCLENERKLRLNKIFVKGEGSEMLQEGKTSESDEEKIKKSNEVVQLESKERESSKINILPTQTSIIETDNKVERILKDESIHFNYSLASRFQRFFAFIINEILLILLFLVFIITSLLIESFSFENEEEFDTYADGIMDKYGTHEIYIIIFVALISAAFYKRYFGNLGHRIFKIKVIDATTGQGIERFESGFMRELIKEFASSIFFLLNIWIFFNPQKQNFYDRIMNTYVVKNKKKAPNKVQNGK